MHKILSLITLTLLAACTPTLPTRMPVQPEMASEITDKPGWAYARQAVAAANPLATQAGHQILRAGGSAVDAAIAAQMVLGLVEPQSSGIGGGAFLMYFDGQQVSAHDGRETAPAGADPRLFLDLQGKPLPFNDAVLSGRSVGVPGAVRMLEAAHRQHGVLPWARLFEQAIDLAEQGFQISPRLNTLLQADPHLRKDPLALRFFYDAQGQARPVGQVLRNPEYAHVLRLIATQGSRALLEGPVAQAIVARTAMPPHPGSLSLQDLSKYQSRDRQALCFDHTALARTYQLCGFPPPSSGHIAIGQILGLLGNTTPQGSEYANGLPSPDYVHRYTQASQLAFADRAQYVADPDFVSAPAGDWRSLLAPDYLRERSQMIGSQSIREAQPGQPGGYKSSYAPMPKQTEYGTSHISVVDAKGRVVAMTASIEAAFGSRRMVTTDAQGLPIANRVEPGKRPRSAMSPTLVFDKASGQVLMTGGSPGGALIIHYTAKLLVGTLHWQLNTQEAINLPNFASLNGPTLLETKRFPALTVNMLKARGHDVLEIDMTSGLQAIQKTSQGWFGGADPRKEGIVLGD